MTWSWKLARIAGIDVYMHATFLMLIGWIAMIHWSEERTMAAVIEGVGFILALFACVVLHEFGHALTARHYGHQDSRYHIASHWRCGSTRTHAG